MNATVAERGQVTIPKEIRDKLGIKPKTVLDFRAEGGVLMAVKVSPENTVSQVRGCLKLKRSVDEMVAEMRGNE